MIENTAKRVALLQPISTLDLIEASQIRRRALEGVIDSIRQEAPIIVDQIKACIRARTPIRISLQIQLDPGPIDPVTGEHLGGEITEHNLEPKAEDIKDLMSEFFGQDGLSAFTLSCLKIYTAAASEQFLDSLDARFVDNLIYELDQALKLPKRTGYMKYLEQELESDFKARVFWEKSLFASFALALFTTFGSRIPLSEQLDQSLAGLPTLALIAVIVSYFIKNYCASRERDNKTELQSILRGVAEPPENLSISALPSEE